MAEVTVAREAFRYELRVVRKKLRRGEALPASAARAELVAFLFKLVRPEPVEVFGAVFFDDRGRTVGYTMPYRGRRDRVGPEKEHLLLKAWGCRAESLVVFHNHPGGTNRPSEQDRLWTQSFLALAAPLGVIVRDHFILAEEPAYFSMADNGTVRGLGVRPESVWSLEEAAQRFERGWREEERGRSRRRRPKPKYRDPETGETWAGRGSMAGWLRRRLEAGEKLEDFAVNGQKGGGGEARLD